MNLKEIRTRIINSVDYDPRNVEWHKFLNESIDLAYQEIWHQYQWVFSTATAQLPVYVDISPSLWDGLNVDVRAFVTHGSITVDLGDGSVEVVHDYDQNQVIEIEGVEYRIQSVPSTIRVYLDRPYQGESGATSNWIIKHRWIPLPIDCADVLNVNWTDAPVPGVALANPVGLTRRMFSQQLLRNDTTSMRPIAFAITPDEYIPAPPEDLPPTVTLSASSTGGYLPAGIYNFTYSYVQGEPTYDFPYIPEGPVWGGNDTYPDGYVSVTVPTAGTNTIHIKLDLPETIYTTGDAAEAWQYLGKLYMVVPTYDGRNVYYEIPTSDNLAPLVVDNGTLTYTVAANNLARKSYVRAPYQGGRVQKIQLFPRPSSGDINVTIDPEQPFYNVTMSYIEVEYLKHPPKIQLDADVPEMPPEFQEAIVQKVVAKIHQRNGNETAMMAAQRSADAIINKLRTRYGDHKSVVVRRGKSWGQGWPNNRYWPYANPAVWTGDF